MSLANEAEWSPPRAWQSYAVDGETFHDPPRRRGPSRRAVAGLAAAVALAVPVGFAPAAAGEDAVLPAGFEQRQVQQVDRSAWIERGGGQ